MTKSGKNGPRIPGCPTFKAPAFHPARAIKSIGCFFVLVTMVLTGGAGTRAYGGGGGENMLLIVNPNDERSLRIENAYVQLRHIPVNNILYIAPPTTQGFTRMDVPNLATFTSAYQTPILAAIAARGLTNQIDYIGTLGQPIRHYYGNMSLQDCLNQLTQFQNGMTSGSAANPGSNSGGAYYRFSELCYYQNSPTPTYGGVPTSFTYVHGTNPAIHHSTKYTPLPSAIGNLPGTTGTANYAQWYMSGMIGYAGHNGLTPTQVIQNLQRTAAADGTKPAGTFYFEYNIDIRTSTRDPYWPAIQSYMTANNIPWIQESVNGGYGAVPINRKNVIGVEIGAANYLPPSGCIYLPGSWADSLTSDGGIYDYLNGQTVNSVVLVSGGGGSSGSVTEPYADSNRFPMASLNVYSLDGSTLGEAYYKTVFVPDVVEFQGDLLSQAYADVPSVSFTSGPANGATVSGSVSLSGSAFLPNLKGQSTATGIAKLELFVDGLDTGMSAAGASGTFNWNTTTLNDGVHEARIVAYNNSQAASEGCAINNYVVNNLGQSVSITGSSGYIVSASGTLSIPVTASGPSLSGTVQLQSLGRVVGSGSGSSVNISLSGTSIAYGPNTITPVALLSGGQQVAGRPVTVTRLFQPMPGKPVTPLGQRDPGIDIYYYTGAAGKSIATTNFSGAPNYTVHATNFEINPSSTTQGINNVPPAYQTSKGGSNVGLAVMVKSNFTVITPGEYAFSFSSTVPSGACYWTSMNLSVDGVTLSNYDCWSGGTLTLLSGGADTAQAAYLQPGEHSLTVKLANYPSGSTSVPDVNMTFIPQFCGVDSNVRGSAPYAMSYSNCSLYGVPQAPFFYTIRKNTGH